MEIKPPVGVGVSSFTKSLFDRSPRDVVSGVVKNDWGVRPWSFSFDPPVVSWVAFPGRRAGGRLGLWACLTTFNRIFLSYV